MKSAGQAISEKPRKVVTIKNGPNNEFSDDVKTLIELRKKGEFIAPKLQHRYESQIIVFVKKLFTEKPNLTKKEAALEILQGMPSNIPSDSFAKLLDAGMKTWMSLKEITR